MTKHSSDYDLKGDVEKIKSALLDVTHDLRGRAGEIFSDSLDGVKNKSEYLKDNVADYTSDKPFKSLGIALLAGIVIGYLIRK